MARCKFCGQEIDWITSLEGKQVPIDPDPVFVIEDGSPDTFLDDMGAAITGRLARPEEERRDLPVAFVPHLRAGPNYRPRVKKSSGKTVQTVTKKMGDYEAALKRCEPIAAKYALDMEAVRREAAGLAVRTKMSHAEALYYITDEWAREAAGKRGGPYG